MIPDLIKAQNLLLKALNTYKYVHILKSVAVKMSNLCHELIPRPIRVATLHGRASKYNININESRKVRSVHFLAFDMVLILLPLPLPHLRNRKFTVKV